MTQLRQRVLEELERRNYSQATVRAYVGAIRRTPAHTRTRSVRRASGLLETALSETGAERLSREIAPVAAVRRPVKPLLSLVVATQQPAGTAGHVKG